MHRARLLRTLLWVPIALTLTAMASPQNSTSSSQVAQPHYVGGGGRVVNRARRMPFVKGPIGADGKVHQVTPQQPARSVPLGMTPEGIAAKKAAEAGSATHSNVPQVQVYTPQQLQALGWNPTKHSLQPPPITAPTQGSASKSGSAKPGSSVITASPAAEFPGAGFTGFIPPDGGVAAGPVNVVETVNGAVNIYDKNGNLLSSQGLAAFFGASDFSFDPSVYYDPYIGRFWVVAASENDSPARSTFMVAVSQTSDATSGWLIYFTDFTVDGGSATNNWCDYPHLGLDSQAIYMSCNQFSFPSTSGSFQYAKVRVMTKDQFVNNTCCSWWDFWNMKEGFLNLFTSFTIRPAIMHFAGNSDGDFWVDATGSGGGGSSLKVWHLTNAQNCCAPTQTGPNLDGNEQGVGGYGSPPGARQPGSSTTIDTGDTRLLFATWQSGHLSTGQNLGCNGGACSAFTEIDVSSYPSMSNVNDWEIGGGTEDLYYPMVDQNVNSDKTMVYTHSNATSTFAGAYYITIPNSGVCTSCVSGESTLQAGSSTYVNLDSTGRNRWGDYHGAGADPDGLGIWIEGEYAAGSSTWGTQVGPTYNNYFPVLSLSSTSLLFGNQPVFSNSASQAEFISNIGNAPLDLGFVGNSGDPQFVITFNNCSFLAIQPGGACEVDEQFDATAVGPASGSLNIPYNFGTGFVGLSATGVQTATSTLLISSANPSVFGQAVTFNASVISSTSGTPTGTVTFKDGPTSLATVGLSGGVAQFTTSTLGTGGHSITAVYNGSSFFLGSSSGVLSQTVNKAASVSTLTSSPNPSQVGTTVTFTAKVVSSTSGVPTGTVTFKDGATVLHTTPLVSGTASFATSTLALGSHTITVVYSGDGNFLPSTSGVLTQKVEDASITKLASSRNPSSYGSGVTFTATVTPKNGSGTPTGTVTFVDGATSIGTVALSGGTAKLTTSSLLTGTHVMKAMYSGSSVFLPSSSSPLSQVVDKATTTTTLTSSLNPSEFDQVVTLTAKVTSTVTPTGTVTFKNGATTLGVKPLAGGTATLAVSSLAVGSHSITAVFNGNTNQLGSTSAVLTQKVKLAPTSVALISSRNPSLFGQTVTITATVKSLTAGVPTGQVTFKDGAATIVTVPLSGGKASFTTSTLSRGTHKLTAVYDGSSSYAISTSPVLTQTVH